MGLGSLLLALVLGLPVSYLTTRTNVPMRRFFQTWLFFPYFIPSFLFAIAWVVLALPQSGILNRWAGTDWISIYNFQGLVLVSCNAFFPIIVTTLSKGFASMDPSLEEAARISGASPLKVFLKINLPCQLPTIFGAGALFLLLVFSSFGIPAIIGSPSKLYVLTTQIYTYSKMGGLDGAEKGFVISLWLIGFAIALIGLRRWVNHTYQVKLTTGKASRPSVIDLGFWKVPSVFFLAILFLVFILLPLGAIFLSSFLKVAGDVSFSNLTTANYNYLFHMNETLSAFGNSFALAFLGGISCCAVGLGISYYVSRYANKRNYILESLATLPFSIPGTVIALALIVSFGRVWGIGNISLLGTPFILLLAYISKDLAISVQTLTPALGQIDKSLEEAGKVCGATSAEVTDKVLFPLLFPALKGVFLLSALPMISELTMSILLFGPGTETVGTLIFQLQDYANPLAACALATFVILILTLGMLFSQRLSRMAS
ncbi:MAG: iron ABC transporter permease [Proteobacteria bacterium]|nr:iron ABC transporter permease [Pseudomonadota bacterium]NDD03780.1 iron ABC transporter permease [Pseudomonadota bacterium]NDG27002.1 iron ABC transporter permease [Pseudomonadota bacterium]